ncbi:MAG: hypothetical protein IPH06_03270 [Alphaproteobacteria bacterium]|nr:hypothetical protein [Alphaproteobacteria bacterium]QQS57061.1 MAG: hypothetical protein IPN28_12520 [Alphaproteobacteria bacterium]
MMKFTRLLLLLLVFSPAVCFAQEAPTVGTLSYYNSDEKILRIIDYDCKKKTSTSLVCGISEDRLEIKKANPNALYPLKSGEAGFQKLLFELDSKTDHRCEFFMAQASLVGKGNEAIKEFYSKLSDSDKEQHNQLMMEYGYISFAYIEAFDQFCRKRSYENYQWLTEADAKTCYLRRDYDEVTFDLVTDKTTNLQQWVKSEALGDLCGLVYTSIFKKEQDWIYRETFKVKFPEKDIPDYGSCRQEDRDPLEFEVAPNHSIPMECKRIFLR